MADCAVISPSSVDLLNADRNCEWCQLYYLHRNLSTLQYSDPGVNNIPKRLQRCDPACTIHAVGAESQTMAISDFRSFLLGHIAHIAS